MVNYIHHIEHIMEKFREDERITPWHVSLYFAMFQIWNNTRFKDEINIRREELMGLSKIGSANTYTRCLKELNEWRYIVYSPSKSRFKSSKIHMYRFDTTPDTTSDTSCDTTPDNTSVHLVRPFLNKSKHIENNTNNLNNSRGVSRTPTCQSPDSNNRTGVSKTPRKTQKRFTPPCIEEVKIFFSENKMNNLEAEKFFNHFESNGWKVGGKASMKNWKAAAKSWILRSANFNKQSNPTLERLNANQNTKYDEPL
jgi:hypothetical protein